MATRRQREAQRYLYRQKFKARVKSGEKNSRLRLRGKNNSLKSTGKVE